MKKSIKQISLLFTLSALALASAVTGESLPLKIALIGDSTVSQYRIDIAMRGWGQLLPEFLPANVTVINEALGGASTKTFPAHRWKKVLAAQPSLVLIQFGHNDSHAKGQPESTNAATEYPDNLRRYVREAREAGVTPIFVTPVRRRTFENGQVTSELTPYVNSMKAVATELSVPVIDLHERSGALYQKLGESGSDTFTLNKLDQADRPGLGDRTHFTETGAREMARLVAEDLNPFLSQLRQ